MRHCRLEALGAACALGSELRDIATRLLSPADSALVLRSGLLPDRELLVGAVEECLPQIPPHLARLRCRNNALALAAARGAHGALEGALSRFCPKRIGVIAATTTSGVVEAGAAVASVLDGAGWPTEFHYAQLEHGGLASFLAATFGAQGPSYTLSTACSSSAKALVSARSLLELGLCDAVVAAGVDTLCKLTANGFAALEALATERSNPFSRNRCGLNLGEAAALFVITREEGGIQLVGCGESSDAHHMSAPNPDGKGAEAAMRGALADARVTPQEVLYVNLHGTGTPLNDASESLAVARVFGESTPCSSSKPRVGHTLGAAGALEAAFCCLVLASERDGALALPPHDWDGERDPALADLHLVGANQRARVRGRRLVASNSFGFGGSNCTLILERTPS